MGGCGHYPRRILSLSVSSGGLVAIGSREVIDDTGPVKLAVVTVNLGNLRLEIIAVSLGETAHYIQLLNLSALFGLAELQDGVDRFLLGVADEAAGVYDYNVGVFRGLVVSLETGLGEHRKEPARNRPGSLNIPMLRH